MVVFLVSYAYMICNKYYIYLSTVDYRLKEKVGKRIQLLPFHIFFRVCCRIFAIIGPLCVKWIFISGNDDDVSCGNIILSTTGDLKMEVQLDWKFVAFMAK